MKKYGKKSGEKGFTLSELKAVLLQTSNAEYESYNKLVMLELIEEIERLEESLKTADNVAINAKVLIERGGVKTVENIRAYLKIWESDWANRIMNPE